jgi:hypothetical protein
MTEFKWPREESSQEYRERVQGLERADILALEGLPDRRLQDRLQQVWDAYREKHLAIRNQDQGVIRRVESELREEITSSLCYDAEALARLLAVLWRRGHSWAPADEPVTATDPWAEPN